MRYSLAALALLSVAGALPQIPDMTQIAKAFPPGKDSGTPVLNSQLPKGPYEVTVGENEAFPDRTVYVPQGVPEGTSIPIFAWENGMCWKYGRMYADFLTEIASQGYLVIAPGKPDAQTNPGTTSKFQVDSVDMAVDWKDAPFTVDAENIALGGHSCGGGETAANLAADKDTQRFKTGLIMNSGSAQKANVIQATVPILWVNGGEPDNEASSEERYAAFVEAKPDVPIFKAVLDTGHLGSYWSARGGIYAETVTHWLDWHLKGDEVAHEWFVGGAESPAAVRGWQVASSAI